MTVPSTTSGCCAAKFPCYTNGFCVQWIFQSLRYDALKYAMSMAQEADAHLIILHVLEHEFQNPAEHQESVVRAGMTIDDVPEASATE